MSTCNYWRNLLRLRPGLALVFSLALFIGLLSVMNTISQSEVALAHQGAATRYVAPTPIGNDSSNDCTSSSAPCAAIQHAVDVAGPGDEIRVATGNYTDVYTRPRNDITTTGVVIQIVYISKTITLRGGYTSSFTDPPDPEANPTTLDAHEQGRVLYITGNISPTIEGLWITGGNAAGLGGGPADEDFGGGIYVITATLTVNKSQIFSNIAHARENGEKGSRGRGGGAFFINSPGPKLDHNVFSSNNSTMGGGVYFLNSPTIMLIANTISNNVADHLGGGQKHYGGVYFDNSHNATLISNIISGNYAANKCGGVCFEDSDNAMLIGNTVFGNMAKQPSGEVVSDGAGIFFSNCKNANLVNNTIIGNRGKDDITQGIILGGGLYIGSNSTVVLSANIISANEATKGGGLFLDSSIVTLRANTIISNAAYTSLNSPPGYNRQGEGGGLFLTNSPVQLDNSIIARNMAATGSGIYMTGTTVLIGWHNTFAGSSGEGIHLSTASNSTVLTNTIFTTFTTAINVQSGMATLERTLWFGNATNTIGVTPADGNNPVYGDPVFRNPGCGDFHISLASAARNRGISGGPDRDIDGDYRPCDLAPDLGADEISCRYLPLILKGGR